jgi:hypothetical protein
MLEKRANINQLRIEVLDSASLALTDVAEELADNPHYT